MGSSIRFCLALFSAINALDKGFVKGEKSLRVYFIHVIRDDPNLRDAHL